MARIYKSICSEADALLLKITNLVQSEVDIKTEMEKLMNRGFVKIAKARYIMGSTCVTKMQLPTENSNPIQPIVTVCRTVSENKYVFHIERKDVCNKQGTKSENFKPISLNEETLQLSQSAKDFNDTKILKNNSNVNFKFLLKNDPRALKNSKIAFNIDDSMYDEYNEAFLDEIPTDSDSAESLVSLADPLRLFGVLVPNTLKESQIIFKDIVNLIGKCATIQGELILALNKYNHLQKVKSLIIAAADKTKKEILKPKIYLMQSSEISSISSDSKNLPFIHESQEEDNALSTGKSIRSIFYEFKDMKQQECDSSQWSSENSEFITEEGSP